VSLQLTSSVTPARTITASAEVRINDPAALRRVLASQTAAQKNVSATAAAKDGMTGATPALDAPTLVLNFALVQKEVRYSGENGIRFHAMVVRQIAKPTTEGFPVAMTGLSANSFIFDPAEVSASLSKYLNTFEEHNPSFGIAHFLMKDTSLPLDELGVAAWVEDPKAHQVVAAAFVPLESHIQEASQ
jgi:hypothetical protein